MPGPGAADRCAPSAEEIAAIAEAVRRALPEPFRGPAAGIVIRVEELAPEATLADLAIADPFELTGLYDGTALIDRLESAPPEGPDTVWLFRRAILDEWAERGDVTLRELVAHILVHEIAHHFGWSDADIAAVDPWWR